MPNKEYYHKYKDRLRQQGSEYKNCAKYKSYMKEYFKKYRKSPKYKAYEREYLERPEVKARKKEYLKKYGKEYEKRIEVKARRRAFDIINKEKRSLRVPAWADLAAITKFYKDCPTGMVVDHIIPLLGKNVSGLHVLSNLQYLTPEENARKSNKYPYNKGE